MPIIIKQKLKIKVFTLSRSEFMETRRKLADKFPLLKIDTDRSVIQIAISKQTRPGGVYFIAVDDIIYENNNYKLDTVNRLFIELENPNAEWKTFDGPSPKRTAKIVNFNSTGKSEKHQVLNHILYQREIISKIGAEKLAGKINLSQYEIIDTTQLSAEDIQFGALVELKNIETGKLQRYQILGAEEAEPSKGTISYKSPMAQALLKKRIGDEVVIPTPKGEKVFLVISVKYGL